MKCVVRYLTKKSRGGVSIKEHPVEAEALTIGRGNDCGVHLQDPRVLLHHAELTLRGGEVYLAPAPNADVRVNGNLTQMTRVNIGDKIEVGPFELFLVENDHAGRIAVTAELVQPLGDDLSRITAQSTIRGSRVSVRTLSWAFGLLIALALFAAPWIASWFHDTPGVRMVLNTRDRAVPAAPTELWSTGSISAAHRFFGDSCETCHTQPFIPVADTTCLTCHEKIEHHADPKQFTFAAFEDRSCQNCHKEHQGNKSIALSDQSFCGDCHADFKAKAPKSDLHEVSDFGTAHPEFRPSIVTDAALHTIDRAKTIAEMPREDSALRFPHNRHMRGSGVRHPTRGNIQMECVNCHQTDGGGGYMLAISFEQHCHECHTLKFDVFVPDRELLHGQPEDLYKQVRDIYDAVAMRGGYQEPEAPALVRRRPGGAQLSVEQKKQALDWAAEKTDALLGGRFGRGLCEGCHETFNTPPGSTAAGPGWNVLPVSASAVWYPKSRFNHSSHRDMECGSCHAARDSVEAAEVLMPGIANCRACHGGEKATDKVPSTCISCHLFHQPGLAPMKNATPAKAAAAPHETMLAAFHGGAKQ